ncbi:hypothetical protein ILYODFUR_014782 [Ilyodon furcidens]|uniref:Uncharacterized protein n=1 Tax=Ilyodon furcidens TaxID=33524 RepID=A0ABV0U5J9_9TELE
MRLLNAWSLLRTAKKFKLNLWSKNIDETRFCQTIFGCEIKWQLAVISIYAVNQKTDLTVCLAAVHLEKTVMIQLCKHDHHKAFPHSTETCDVCKESRIEIYGGLCL